MTRSSSTNLNLVKAITGFAKEKFAMSVFDALTILPHFNADLDTDNPPKEVSGFRNLLKNIDGILV